MGAGCAWPLFFARRARRVFARPARPALHETKVCVCDSGFVQVVQILPVPQLARLSLSETDELALIKADLVRIEREQILARAVVERRSHHWHWVYEPHWLWTGHRVLDP